MSIHVVSVYCLPKLYSALKTTQAIAGLLSDCSRWLLSGRETAAAFSLRNTFLFSGI
jgi:hypothetical protein